MHPVLILVQHGQIPKAMEVKLMAVPILMPVIIILKPQKMMAHVLIMMNVVFVMEIIAHVQTVPAYRMVMQN